MITKIEVDYKWIISVKEERKAWADFDLLLNHKVICIKPFFTKYLLIPKCAIWPWGSSSTIHWYFLTGWLAGIIYFSSIPAFSICTYRPNSRGENFYHWLLMSRQSNFSFIILLFFSIHYNKYARLHLLSCSLHFYCVSHRINAVIYFYISFTFMVRIVRWGNQNRWVFWERKRKKTPAWYEQFPAIPYNETQ